MRDIEAAVRALGPSAVVAAVATVSGAALVRVSQAWIAAAVVANAVLAVSVVRLLHRRAPAVSPDALPQGSQRSDETAELNARLALAVQQGAEAVMMTDVGGRIIYVNPAFERITGFTAQEAVGQTPSILAAERQDRAVYHDLWQTILRGEVWRAEITNRRKDGTPFTWEEAITPIRDERGRLTHFIAVGQDISVQRQLQAQLLQAQKMEAIGRLAGGVAHDFNNLLTVMTGYSEQMIDRLESHDPLRRKAEAIRSAAHRAAGLTQQLLAFSRRQMQQPRIVDLNEAVGRMNRLLRRLIGEDVDLVSELSEIPTRVRADPLHLEQVLMNLAVNARDAMPRGGVLTLGTRVERLDVGDLAEHPQMPPGEYVLLTVRDNGCGMDAETRRRLFEPFFTTKEQGKGTGLGLSTVYGIVKQNGGYIWVDSEPGRGAEFRIYLPLVSEAADADHLPPPVQKAPGGKETLLVVEDDDDVRRVLKDELQQFGYTVLDASNGGEALLFCERYPGTIHALVTDIVMPHMDGYEVAERLRAVRPGLRALFISGYSDQAAARQSRGGPEDAFLAKPFTPGVLADRVRDVLTSSPAAA
jgi:two-component system, cell cycle sensor histidine kinase and response regulator CckA